MTRRLLLAAAALAFATPASAGAISDAVRVDMPQLMTLYRDLHSNPELSMQEVRTPAKLAAWTAVARVLLNLDETISKE